MYLNRGGSGVVGLFYDTLGDWTPTYLGGEWKADAITLKAESADDRLIKSVHVRAAAAAR